MKIIVVDGATLNPGDLSWEPLGTTIYGGEMYYDLDTYKAIVEQGFALLLIGGGEWMLSAACRKLVERVAPLWSPARAEGKAR